MRRGPTEPERPLPRGSWGGTTRWKFSMLGLLKGGSNRLDGTPPEVQNSTEGHKHGG